MEEGGGVDVKSVSSAQEFCGPLKAADDFRCFGSGRMHRFLGKPDMIVPIDRTEELVALLLRNSDKATKETVLYIPDAVARHPFTTLATELSDKIRDMRLFLQGSKRKYEDFSARGMRDVDRDEVDGAVATFLEYAMGQIELLKNEAAAQPQSGRAHGSYSAHKLGVVVILNGELQAVGRLSEELRGIRIKNAIADDSRREVRVDAQVARQVAREMRRREDHDDSMAIQETDAGLVQMLAVENASLVTELVDTRERVQAVERAVVEIASLNHVFATKVLEQARDIETLYELAVDASNYVEHGNRELREMRERGPILKYYLALFIFMLSMCLIIADWANTRRSLLLF